jgi:hypothetical protein
MPDDVAGHEVGRLGRVVLVEHLVDVVARELLVGFELLGGNGHRPSCESLRDQANNVVLKAIRHLFAASSKDSG